MVVYSPAMAAPKKTSTRFDLTSLGEIMLRLSVPTGARLDDSSSLDLEIVGAEGNVTLALSRLGRCVAWLGRLPEQHLGEIVLRTLRADGVDVSGVCRAPNERMGLYFIEYASAPRSIHVIYDRADSAAARMTVDHVDWDTLLNTKILHMTGITPALSPSCLKITQESIRRAKELGVTVSFDVNFRSKLWDPAAAADALRPLMRQADVLFCKRSDAELLFSCSGEPAQQLASLAQLSGAKTIYLTCGDSGAWMLHAGKVSSLPAVPATIVDRVGSGDAFAAGALDGLLDGDAEAGLARGVALASIALSQHGDRVLSSQRELNSVLAQRPTDISR
jgi:2-dehydro-3-deoxygluconokinase